MSKNKKKHKSPQAQKPTKFSPEKYIVEHCRKLPVHKCLINPDWQEQGMASIWILKKRQNGVIIMGSFLVDTCCLGLKDTFFRYDIDEDTLEKYTDSLMIIGRTMIDCDFGLAQNIIYGGIEYAEELGFKPYKEFKITQFIIDDIEEVDFMEIEFGKDGKPFFSAGPKDNVNAILNTLNRTVGQGNYEYIVDINPFMDDDWDDEDDFDEEEEDNVEDDNVDEQEKGFTEFEEMK
jgi:hypothetical protein